MEINRRESLKALAALTTVPYLKDLDLDLDENVERAWRAAIDDPFVFEVVSDGYLLITDFEGPHTRADLYGISPHSIKNLSDLKDEIELYHQLYDVMRDAYQDFRDEMETAYEDSLSDSDSDEIETNPAGTAISDNPEEWPSEYGEWDEKLIQRWIAKVGINEFLEDIKKRIEDWLEEVPGDYDFESYEFTSQPGVAEYAFDFFKGFGSEFVNELGFEIAESYFPGDNTTMIRLSIPVGEANRICEAGGIPIRFKEVGYAQ